MNCNGIFQINKNCNGTYKKNPPFKTINDLDGLVATNHASGPHTFELHPRSTFHYSQ
jgi:hypothetical protein